MKVQCHNRIILIISLLTRIPSFVNASPCAQLIVSGCVDTSMEDDITGVFQPYDGSCSDADTSRSMYVRKTESKEVYLFYHNDRDRWYFDAAGYNDCGANYKHQLSTEFEGGMEPWIDISWNGFPGEADCYDGLDSDNKFSFSREPISITCDSSTKGGDDPLEGGSPGGDSPTGSPGGDDPLGGGSPGGGNPGGDSPGGNASGAISMQSNCFTFLVGSAAASALLVFG
eukprot:CAMPEP_0185732438 /NCGR_PEP_ID=MMETSP1171-20130828/16210_1 /TAXON_ID=374046 /ORGANISM="Helicotheca tamensis, Strain CCMP826" /LENGTH=227 /DNA_ID=CAMNT_0028401935 /DNA_START=20 /DNA_END=703 /DNA_ORIENTATION=+